MNPEQFALTDDLLAFITREEAEDRPLCECTTEPGGHKCPRDATHRIRALYPEGHDCAGMKGCITCTPHAEMFRCYFEAGLLKCENCPQKVTGIDIRPLGGRDE